MRGAAEEGEGGAGGGGGLGLDKGVSRTVGLFLETFGVASFEVGRGMTFGGFFVFFCV